MKSWYSLNLGDAMMAHQPLEQIREAFDKFDSTNVESKSFAIFTLNDSEGRLHCEVTAYFSPAASEIAKIFQAEVCDRPSKDNLDLFAGDESCWAELFPQQV